MAEERDTSGTANRADEQKTRLAVRYGEQAAGEVTVRDMRSGEQTRLPLAEAALHAREALG
ncbi:hypothetical protein JJV70_11000 [Streptomyces sp. JJ66]|uniref:His/Gly/Thr/Pro-type tRNA ligase C-terminal domain-containing protein n=1 Tax=Streptomyces sp. JJ66 TaxID=2803843 RepID=UPI001C57AF04|nr:His/Gly/Thr/Pro-type tRNA ligase C-terminal domain-containing protein [Streptomyces sp. JJ66]MBW1602624.1 hypothetical protein [Streptomyces sp. JJ66]